MNVRDMGVLRLRRRDSQGPFTKYESQLAGVNAFSSRRRVDQVAKPRETKAHFVYGAISERLGVPNVDDLRAPCEVAAKTGQRNAGYALFILVEEIISADQAKPGVVVHSSAGLVISQTRRLRRVGNEEAGGAVNLGHRQNKWQQFRGRRGKQAGWDLRVGKNTSGGRSAPG